MRPQVIVFAAVSVDGFTEGFEVDQRAFYELVRQSPEDVTLAGSNTILAVPGAETDPKSPPDVAQFNRQGPVLAVVDSKGRIDVWDWLRRQPHWRDVVAVGCDATPPGTRREWVRRGLKSIVTPGDRVDLQDAIGRLGSECGARHVRIESGGTLNGVLLAQNLVDEIALLVHPAVVGGTHRTLFSGMLESASRARHLRLIEAHAVGSGLAHLKYRVVPGA
jgi:2,5-diamino-6-(ribosylamino)-4(3H)-pyrimidinone 5'-phosphate reductase